MKYYILFVTASIVQWLSNLLPAMTSTTTVLQLPFIEFIYAYLFTDLISLILM